MNNEEIKALWMSVFPNSHAVVNIGPLGGGVYIKGYLQKPGEWINGISHNDPLSYTGWVNGEEYKEDGTMLLRRSNVPHMVFSWARMRKKTIKQITPEKLLKRFQEIREFVRANLENMPERYDIRGKV